MNPMLVIDFETRSHVNLLTSGAYLYAEDPSTEIISMSYSWTDGTNMYTWEVGDMVPSAIVDHIESGNFVAAHNAEFDWQIWNLVATQHGFRKCP